MDSGTSMIRAGREASYREHWQAKTTKQVEKELKSWQAHFAKHESAYKWHASMTAPGELTDGDRVRILKDILRDRSNGRSA